MAKLLRVQEAKLLMPYIEYWLLENNLEMTIYYEIFCQIKIFSSTGDVADQIYGIMIKAERFKAIKLNATLCYLIEIDQNFIKDFMNEVEKINIKSLKEGKSY